MKTVSAKQAHSQLGAVLEDSQHEPVVIQKNGRPYSVVLSVREFERIRAGESREARVEKLLASVGALHVQADRGGLTPDKALDIADGR